MLKLTDSGCAQHPPRHTTLTGLAATLVGHLVINLPVTNGGHTYICEHGHTHRLTFESREGNVTTSPPRFGFAGKTVLNR